MLDGDGFGTTSLTASIKSEMLERIFRWVDDIAQSFFGWVGRHVPLIGRTIARLFLHGDGRVRVWTVVLVAATLALALLLWLVSEYVEYKVRSHADLGRDQEQPRPASCAPALLPDSVLHAPRAPRDHRCICGAPHLEDHRFCEQCGRRLN